MSGSLKIGNVTLEAPSSWKFYDFDVMIMGQPDSKLGSLQISRAFRSDAGQNPTADTLCGFARQFAGVENASSGVDIWNTANGSNHAGGGRVRTETELNYYFYSWTPTGLIVATFKTDSDDFAKVESLADECKQIISSARFAS